MEKGGRLLGGKELLVVVAHGSEPVKASLFRSGAPTLGGYSGADLAEKLAGLFPQDYAGSIYLDGCFTGKRLAYAEGTSFIEHFAAALAQLRPDIKFRAQGNIGAAATGKDGVEYITLTPDEAKLAGALGWSVIEQDKDGTTEYVVASPFGQAYADQTGGYNDMGLTRQAEKEAREKQAQEKEKESKRVYPHPQMSQEEQDAAWNTLL